MDDFVNPDKSGGAGSAKNDDAAVIFLRQLRPAGPWMLLAIDPESGRIEAKTIENTDGVRSFVAKHNGTRNLYYSLNPTRTRMGKKAAKTDIARIEYVPTDLDPKHDEPPEDAKKRYLTEIGKFKKKPTAVIDSGNGLNVIFKLAKPIELPEPVIAKGRRRPNGEPQSESLVFDDETQKVIADIEGRAAQLMKDLGSAAGTQNIDRILRLPGTTNLPTKKKLREGRVQCQAKLIEFGTSTFAPDDFPKAPAHQHGESQSKPKDDKKAKASRPPGTKKELSPRLIGMLMVPNGGAGVKHYYDGYTYESRSGLLYGFLRGCISESIDSYVMYAACVDGKYSGKAIYEHVAEQGGDPYGSYLDRQIERAEAKFDAEDTNPNAPASGFLSGATIDDFYSLLPVHKYIYKHSGELWLLSTIDSLFGSVVIGQEPVKKKKPKKPKKAKKDEAAAVEEDEEDDEEVEMKDKKIPASMWLDRNRPVAQMCWAPGYPQLVKDKLTSEGGWVDRPGVTIFNNYRPPAKVAGDPSKAGPWLDLVKRLYPNEANHIIGFFAHRAQKPGEKPNHCVVLAGPPGVGKDTLLEPLKYAVGPWNFREIAASDVMSAHNDFMKSVVLRISETHDLGDTDRFKFYEKTKTIIAAPPNTTRINIKYIPQYEAMNVTGVVATTNHPNDGLYLTADDRRHFVCSTEVTISDPENAKLPALWDWYHSGGFDHVVAFLQTFDLSKSTFDAKRPPPKTTGFWRMVDAGRAPEDSHFMDAIDELGKTDEETGKVTPAPAITLEMLKFNASHGTGRLVQGTDQPPQDATPS